ncbi:MAG: hypothetical protein NC432_09340 [Roseburia sp.]|nr:hypothetical protein [Roseburia sp.]
MLAWTVGECREGQIPRPLGRFKLDAPLLAAGYLTPVMTIGIFAAGMLTGWIVGKIPVIGKWFTFQ